MSDTMGTMETTLTALDRCDRCGAQAYVRVTLPAGGELLFCGHHSDEHLPALRQIEGVQVQDETDKLKVAP